MEEVEQAIQMATSSGGDNLFLTILVLIIAIVFVGENIMKFRDMFGIRTKFSDHEQKQNDEINNLKNDINLIKTEINNLYSITTVREDKCTKFENGVTDVLGDIKKELLDQQIDSIRIQILDFANGLQKRKYSQEYFAHIFELYNKYKQLILDNSLENGRIEVSMEKIKQAFSKCQEEGFLD